MSSKELEWGQTPFDECTREELIQHCARLYSATSALSSVAQMIQDKSFFWTKGSGAEALEKGRQALQIARNGFEAENIHRAYLRYAGDLLFADAPGLEVRTGWVVCPVCEQMASTTDSASNVGKACSELLPGECSGLLRELSWVDLKPVTAKS
ncbi:MULTISPECIES: hypothetical protein [Ectopseudomonas]|uniref:Uncharacterized protein n=2 Tax=Ectopseudomonas TaxID=3236654 RepID=A0A1G6PV16_9GAMM|nr:MULTISPECIES: hypothetical protein [Pseudomonas]ALN21887.1 hypothetical protein DW68_024730 [Pseudomonas mendocina S5.2]KER98058.1 hypothetical protein HN51_24975 [Pseudomonas mendocina]MBP3061942.1 hypothetical protein [Pseudomonas chengduensis]NNB75234.1 hypothetical protein [Pseudomonas chengduensis]SDC84060.1 hypothetical protein SAMN05216576_107111 [Pseudomonas chengduensis]